MPWTPSEDGLVCICLTSDPGNLLELMTSSLDYYIWIVLMETVCDGDSKAEDTLGQQGLGFLFFLYI